MTTPICPNCGKVIVSADVSVANDVAYCRACNAGHKLSELVHGVGLASNPNLQAPPAGAWFQTGESGTVVGATHRSVVSALGMLFISLFWNGITSVFVFIAIGATLNNVGIESPEWLPAFDGDDMGVGMTIFLWVFLSPFIVIGMGMILGLLSSLFGRTELTIHQGEVELYRGIGPFGLRRRWAAALVKEVRIDDRRWRDSDGDAQRKTVIAVELRDGKPIRFGTQLTEERRRFMAAVLRKLLVK